LIHAIDAATTSVLKDQFKRDPPIGGFFLSSVRVDRKAPKPSSSAVAATYSAATLSQEKPNSQNSRSATRRAPLAPTRPSSASPGNDWNSRSQVGAVTSVVDIRAARRGIIAGHDEQP